MVKQFIVDILVKKIQNGEINPKTDEVFKLADIKIQEYKDAVDAILTPNKHKRCS